MNACVTTTASGGFVIVIVTTCSHSFSQPASQPLRCRQKPRAGFIGQEARNVPKNTLFSLTLTSSGCKESALGLMVVFELCVQTHRMSAGS